MRIMMLISFYVIKVNQINHVKNIHLDYED